MIKGQRISAAGESEIVTMDAEQSESFEQSRGLSRGDYISSVKRKARTVRDGGATINGIFVSTDAEARSLLTGAKVHPKAERKIVARGGRAIVDQETYDAIVQGVSDFIQQVFDREFDLLEQIDAASDADLPSIDIQAGWPA